MPDIAPGLWADATAMHKYEDAWVRYRQPWLEAASMAFTNVFNLRPPSNKIEELCQDKKAAQAEGGLAASLPPLARAKYLRPEFLPEVSRLHEELLTCRPNLVVALGNTACWALLSATNIGAIRGTVTSGFGPLAGLKVLPTYHPAGVLRQWSWRTIVISDFIKVARELKFPEIRRPQREVLVNPTLPAAAEAAARILADAQAAGLPLACDIETAVGQITCISFASSKDFALTIPFVDLEHPTRSYWPSEADELEAWGIVRKLLESPVPKLGQNFIYDLQYITKMGIFPRNCHEDTMLLHHSLFPEMQKGLGFLGSIYTDEPAWKLMRRKRPDTEKRDE
jgi:hypothetical protein